MLAPPTTKIGFWHHKKWRLQLDFSAVLSSLFHVYNSVYGFPYEIEILQCPLVLVGYEYRVEYFWVFLGTNVVFRVFLVESQNDEKFSEGKCFTFYIEDDWMSGFLNRIDISC